MKLNNNSFTNNSRNHVPVGPEIRRLQKPVKRDKLQRANVCLFAAGT